MAVTKPPGRVGVGLGLEVRSASKGCLGNHFPRTFTFHRKVRKIPVLSKSPPPCNPPHHRTPPDWPVVEVLPNGPHPFNVTFRLPSSAELCRALPSDCRALPSYKTQRKKWKTFLTHPRQGQRGDIKGPQRLLGSARGGLRPRSKSERASFVLSPTDPPLERSGTPMTSFRTPQTKAGRNLKFNIDL